MDTNTKQPTIDLNALRLNYDRADRHYECSNQDPDAASEAFYCAYEYISGLEGENTRKDAVIAQQADEIRLLRAELARARQQADGAVNFGFEDGGCAGK